ncbi:MAG: acetylglutamate kinase [Candidatus Omnitrophica bacterium]|nr:acetylglutamate kinase [Candidatus Omnitrophota bacterium]
MEEFIKKAGVLIEAIPYIHAFRRKVFVIKYGGSILDNESIRKNVLEDIVFLSYVGIRTVLVHGGGPHVNERMKEAGIKSEFHNGIRVTDEKTLSIVRQEFRALNNKLVKEIKELKGDVTGIKGTEHVISVEKRKAEVDLGFVGSVTAVDVETINSHLRRGHIAVMSPIGLDDNNQAYNINADDVASAVAEAMGAEKLVFLTNVQGVLRDPEDENSLISTLTIDEIKNLIQLNVISGGMIPKVQSCVDALNQGVKKIHIVDARIQHALLLEFFTNRGIGTQILHG